MPVRFSGPYGEFNYFPTLGAELGASGFDVVSTANDHCLDRGQLGINETLQNLALGGVEHAGTRRSVEVCSTPP